MSCSELEVFREAYVDGEFDGPEVADIEAHLAACSRCRAAVELQRAFQRRLRAAAGEESPLNPAAPGRLRATLESRLAEARRERRRGSLWPALGWSAALAAAAAGLALYVRASISRERAAALVAAAIENHHRELPLEVQGQELRPIQSWFQGKVDFAPSRIPELRKVSVLGGRLSSINDRQAAYVVYTAPGRRRVSLFVFDAPDLRLPAGRRINDHDVLLANEHGYNVALWKDQEIAYSLVSDLGEQDVVDLVAATGR